MKLVARVPELTKGRAFIVELSKPRPHPATADSTRKDRKNLQIRRKKSKEPRPDRT
jgi:hypothetical protein